MRNYAHLFILAGIIMIIIGILLKKTDFLSFLGRLPGDIRVERENFRFYFPFTTMIIISLVVSLIIRLFKK